MQVEIPSANVMRISGVHRFLFSAMSCGNCWFTPYSSVYAFSKSIQHENSPLFNSFVSHDISGIAKHYQQQTCTELQRGSVFSSELVSLSFSWTCTRKSKCAISAMSNMHGSFVTVCCMYNLYKFVYTCSCCIVYYRNSYK